MPVAYDATVGEIGRTITLQTGGYNITGGTATIIITPPGLAALSKTATISGDGLSASYVTVSGDLSVVGTYKIQLKVVINSKTLYNQPVISFEVGPALA